MELSTTKNNDKRTKRKIVNEDSFFVYLFNNQTVQLVEETEEVENRFIQFHFCLKGEAEFFFNEKKYIMDLEEKKSILLFNPNVNIPINLNIPPNSVVLSLLISIEKFHGLFSKDAHHITFLNPENRNKKHYSSRATNPEMAIVLNQILNSMTHTTMEKLYLKAKTYELLSLYFTSVSSSSLKECPFLVDEENVKKIQQARDILIENMASPPSLSELSSQIGLSLNRLKEGYKQLYGESIYHHLLEYKLEESKRMLSLGTYNVNEVGAKIGYSTSSHFIAAFKKKYGITPKKYQSNNERNFIS